LRLDLFLQLFDFLPAVVSGRERFLPEVLFDDLDLSHHLGLVALELGDFLNRLTIALFDIIICIVAFL
jgi:hypothetical protein